MTRRRILNYTSKKKADVMISAFVLAPNATPVVGAGVTLDGDKQFNSLWCATSRDMTLGTNLPGNEALRTSDTCFMRGLKEKITFSSNTGASWRWRRICFTVKGGIISSSTELETSNQGWTRLLYDLAVNSSTDLTALRTAVFKGAAGLDWADPFTAPVDNGRVTIKYDRTMTINSGNANGRYLTKSMWHPMNKNLVYSNDQQGPDMSPDYRSVVGKAGMGDYYVYDIIECATKAVADKLVFNPEATLYWHEK